METMQSMMDARTPLEIMAARGIVPVGGVWWRCERCGEMLRAACDCCEPQTNHDCVAAR